MNARFSATKNLSLHASDGPIGKVVDMLVDDSHWMVRYLVVSLPNNETGESSQVLISPEAVSEIDFQTRTVTTTLDSERIKCSPSLDNAKSVSRQHELALADHYGWSLYWVGQAILSPQTLGRLVSDVDLDAKDNESSNLRSAAEICGYQIRSRNGAAGVMNDLVINTRLWRVVNGVAESSTWLPSESSMFLTSHIESVNWPKREITVDLSREALLPSANQFLRSLSQAAVFFEQPTPVR